MSDLTKVNELLGRKIEMPTADVPLQASSDLTVVEEGSMTPTGEEAVKAYELEEMSRFEEAIKPKEGGKTTAEMFRHMSAEQRKVALKTAHVKQMKGVGQNHPFWVDSKAVPDTIHLYWLSSNTVARIGMRGYSRVPVSKESLKWVPNIRPLGGSRWIQHANYVLGWIPMETYFEDRVHEFRTVEGSVEEHGRGFKSALKSAAGQIGMPSHKAAELDRTQGTGVIATRGLDPGSPGAVDSVVGEGEE